nr:hypothetical protein [Tanacetum cinerariifolium]
MSTRSSARNLFPPLDNPKLTIRRRSRADPTLLNHCEMAAEGPGDLIVPDLRTMEKLCQPSLNGRGGSIAPIAIHATNFGLKNDMIQQDVPPTLKDLKFWTAEEKKTRKIDHLARSILIQGLPNDIYSLIDSNKTAKDLWDALESQMRGSEYGEQDRKAVILYEYETFKAIEGEKLLDTYPCYLQVINDLKKYSYKKDNCELNYKFLNNLQPEWKQYGTQMRQTKNLMDINIDALYNILKQNQGDVN